MSKYLKDWKNFLVEKQLDLFQGTFWERPELKYKNYWPITPEEIDDLLDFYYTLKLYESKI